MKKRNVQKMAVAGVMIFICLAGGCKKNQEQQAITFFGDAVLDGYAQQGGIAIATEEGFIGDSSEGNTFKAWVSFNLSGIPANATIESAVLSIFQTSTSVSGYLLGPVLVDHIYFGTDTNDAYNVNALSTLAAMLSTAFSQGYKSITVTAEVQDDVNNNRSRSQFRIYHQITTNNDNLSDDDGWTMGDSAVNKPQLVVTYH